jgi:hypothetical protein
MKAKKKKKGMEYTHGQGKEDQVKMSIYPVVFLVEENIQCIFFLFRISVMELKKIKIRMEKVKCRAIKMSQGNTRIYFQGMLCSYTIAIKYR